MGVHEVEIGNIGNMVSAGNSSNTPLTGGGVFTGAWEDVSRFSTVAVVAISDVASAVEGLAVEFSTDGTNVDAADHHTVAAGLTEGHVIRHGLHCKYFRVKYTNGAAPQTVFRLGVKYFSVAHVDLHPIEDEIDSDDRATLNRAILVAKSPDNDYHNVRSDETGALIVTSPAQATSTRKGFRKATFNANSGAGNELTFYGGTYTEQGSNAQRSLASSSNNDTISGGTGARTVKITYLTATFTGPFEEIVSMSGTVGANTVATNICYIEKMEVVSVGGVGNNIGLITLYSAINKGGVTVAQILATLNETMYLHHYTPADYVTYITSISGFIDAAKLSLFYLKSKALNVSNTYDKIVSDYLVMAQAAAQTGSIPIPRVYGTPIEILGPARTRAYAQGVASPTNYYASFDYFELGVE